MGSNRTGKAFVRSSKPNYFKPASFGSFELSHHERNENRAPKIDWFDENLKTISMITIDDLELNQIDRIKVISVQLKNAFLRNKQRGLGRASTNVGCTSIAFL